MCVNSNQQSALMNCNVESVTIQNTAVYPADVHFKQVLLYSKPKLADSKTIQIWVDYVAADVYNVPLTFEYQLMDESVPVLSFLDSGFYKHHS